MNSLRHPLARIASPALIALAASACGGAQHGTVEMGEPVVVELDFEPMVIQWREDDEGNMTTVASEVPDLFDEAGDYLRADSYEDALRLYDLILANSTHEEYLRASNYNSALALESLERWADAATRYRRVIDSWPATEDATDAFFRLAECEARLGNFDVVPPLMETVLPRMGLSVEARFEAHLRWGNAMLELRRFDGAVEHYREALRINDSARLSWNPESSDPAARPVEGADPLLAHVYFALGRVYHELFGEIRLVLPQEQLATDLVDKTQLFDQAQDWYLDAVRTGNPFWAPAAGFMVGQLFEDYYFDVLAAEVPDDFDELEVEVYFEELREFVRPAMERAMGVYEHNLAMAYRLGSRNVWVDDTLASVERVHHYLEERPGWEEEHRQIVERRHPHSAFQAQHMQFRSELDAPSSR